MIKPKTVLTEATEFTPASQDGLFEYAEQLGFGEIHIKTDEKTGLRAIIAIHSTSRGPAIGGCRCIAYPSESDAFKDALRLAQMMSYKAAICEIPHGGGKAVLVRPPVIKNQTAYFRSFGHFVQELNGRYITGVDSGTGSPEMDIIAQVTPYVTCTTVQGDPSWHTALGVRLGIEAAVHFKLGKPKLNGIRVAIQGAGHVGYELAKELKAKGAIVIQCDIDSQRLQQCVEELGVIPVSVENIYDVECEVFAPCAWGSILNPQTIPRLKANIVAGSANNQLLNKEQAMLLHQRSILYAPDFVINSGGVMYEAALYNRGNVERVIPFINTLYNALWHIFERAQAENHPTHDIAEVIAQEKIAAAQEN